MTVGNHHDSLHPPHEHGGTMASEREEVTEPQALDDHWWIFQSRFIDPAIGLHPYLAVIQLKHGIATPPFEGARDPALDSRGFTTRLRRQHLLAEAVGAARCGGCGESSERRHCHDCPSR